MLMRGAPFLRAHDNPPMILSLVSNVAGRRRAVAAQGRALIALYGRRAILMRHEASRNAAGQ